MNKSTAKYIFEEYYNGNKNFMTPIVVRFYHRKFKRGIVVFELTRNKESLFGVTTLLVNGNEVRRIKLNKAFGNETEAIDYINELQNEDVLAADVAEMRIIGGI